MRIKNRIASISPLLRQAESETALIPILSWVKHGDYYLRL